jgi:hypothetical protein
MTKKFGIFRFLGNELPPRDLAGSKIRILEFILQNEAPHPLTDKWWVVNHVFDPTMRHNLCAVLHHYNAKYIHLPFDRAAYDSASFGKGKLVAAIPINQARNLAIGLGKGLYEYLAVLDGDCFFPGDQWSRAVEEIEAHPSSYYSLAMMRSSIQRELERQVPDLVDEPQLVFRHDAPLRFDEALPWGNFRDKLDLLARLGHKDTPDSWHLLDRNDECRQVGVVHHLASGPVEYELEPDPTKRAFALFQLREEALNLFLSQLCEFHIPLEGPGQ